MIERALYYIAFSKEWGRQMRFVTGPRQSGKTTLAKRILADFGTGTYLSWDSRADRKEIRSAMWPGGEALVVLDELHKWRQWKGWIKGEYDKHGERLRFLVTGSARFDVFRRGGDSLMGRYFLHRLHPLTVGELLDAAERDGEIRAPRLLPTSEWEALNPRS